MTGENGLSDRRGVESEEVEEKQDTDGGDLKMGLL